MKSFVLMALSLLAAGGCASAPSVSGVFDITRFGAVRSETKSSTRQIQSAINACAAAGGGTVLVPPGSFVTGSLWLRSNVNLHLASGAMLLGSQDMNEFPIWTSQWEGPGVEKRRAPLICGEGLENISLTGRGTIDARGEIWWKLQRASPGKEVLRPLLFRVVDCRNVLIEGLTFRRSPMWTISPLACNNVTIRNIIIQNPPDSPNTDGINPDSCHNVHISDCHIDVGDDCITIKCGKETDGRRELRSAENYTITNCTMLHGHGGVVIGSEMSGSVRNIAISNCVFIGTDRGLRFKARRGRGGVVEDVSADNIVMDGVLCPIAINLFYESGARGEKKVTDQSPFPVDESTPQFRRLRFSNILARRVKYSAAYMLGLPEMHVEDVVCDNLAFYIDADTKESGKPEMAPGAPQVSRRGIIARRVDKLTLRNVSVADQVGPAVSIDEARDLLLCDLNLRTPQQSAAMVELNNVQEASLDGVRIPDGAAIGLRVDGAQTTRVHLGDNDFSRAQKSTQIDKAISSQAITMPKSDH